MSHDPYDAWMLDRWERYASATEGEDVLRACEWCGEPTNYAALCRSCSEDAANGCDGPSEVTL